MTANADDDTTIALDTLLVTFRNTVVDGDRITAAERRMALARGEGLVDDLNKVHLSLYSLFD